MSQTIAITIAGKIATAAETEIVSYNSDYRLSFSFDGEWNEYQTRVAVVRWAGGGAETFFEGNECAMPVVDAPENDCVYVGVYALSGERRIASSFVRFYCRAGANRIPGKAPSKNVQEQILAALNEKDWSIFEEKVQAGAYTSVTVDKYGFVVEGGAGVEVGAEAQSAPSDSLAVGGLFLQNNDGIYTLNEKTESGVRSLPMQSAKLANALTVGAKAFDGSQAIAVTRADLGLSAAFIPQGTVTFAQLPTPSAATLGFVYNVSDAFVTNASFAEGAGKSYGAGANVTVVQSGSAYLFDVLGGFVDLSSYALKSELNEIPLSKVYPIGSIYLSAGSTSPASLFGGTWARLEGKFLLGANSSYALGSTGGEATHTLTTGEMPSHTHSFNKTPTFGTKGDWDGGYQTMYDGDSFYKGTSALSITATGGGGAHNNMPPYLAVNIWKRTA